MESQAFLLNGSKMDFCDSLPLTSCAEAAACKLPGSYWEELNCLALGKELEVQLFLRQQCS